MQRYNISSKSVTHSCSDSLGSFKFISFLVLLIECISDSDCYFDPKLPYCDFDDGYRCKGKKYWSEVLGSNIQANDFYNKEWTIFTSSSESIKPTTYISTRLTSTTESIHKPNSTTSIQTKWVNGQLH